MITIALIIFLLCIAISRLLVSRSVATLSTEQKAMLVDASAGKRPWFFVAMLTLLLVWALVTKTFGHRDWLFVVFMIAILASWILMIFLSLRRLSGLALSAAYLRSVRISSVLLVFGIVVFLWAMVYSVLTFVPK